MTSVFLVTTGQTNWDTEERIQGSLSIPLNAHGVVQIARLASETGDVKLDRIYTGESQDAVQTASILAKAWGASVRRRAELNDVNLGVWQGLLQAEVARRFGRDYRQWRRDPLSVEPPGGEALDAAYARIAPEVRRILRAHPKGTVGIVCGALASALVKCYLKDLDLRSAVKLCPEPAHHEIIEFR